MRVLLKKVFLEKGFFIKFDFKTHRVLKIIRTLAAAAILLLAVFGHPYLREDVVHGTGIIMGESYEFTPYLSTSEDVILQTFRPAATGLHTISIRMANEWPDRIDNVLEFTILDAAGTELWNTRIHSSEMITWRYTDIFPDVKFSLLRDYTLKITCPETRSPATWWKMFLCNEKLKENRKLTFDGEELEGGLDLMFEYDAFPIKEFLIVIIACLALLVLTWTEIPFLRKPAFGWYVTLPVTALVCLEMIENLSFGSVEGLLPYAKLVNYFFILGLMIIPGIASPLSTVGGRVITLILALLSIINHYTLMFRGTLILPSDLYSIGTAANVAENYKIVPDIMVLKYLTVCLAVLVILKKTEPGRQRPALRIAGGFVGIAAMIPMILFSASPVFAQRADLYIRQDDQTNRSREIGFLLNLGENFRYIFIIKPSGYSDRAANELLLKAEEEMKTRLPEQTAERPDNIIIIMNESLTDLRMLGHFETDGEYFTNFYKAAESKNSKTGECAVSVIGGGTSCTEFEALTGCTMQFLGSGNAPYQQYIHKDTKSLATITSDLGYDTFAVHAANPKSWYRDVAYPKLGFDRFISNQDEEFADATYCRYWIDDQSMMDEVIRLYETDENPEFNFALTIQCHGGYDYEDYESTVHITNLEDEYPAADQYLSLIKETDEAFGSLIENLKGSEEKTIVLMFGDHLPGLGDPFFNEISAGWQDSEEEKNLQMFETPYIFWANYDVDFSDIPDELSANYLGAYLLKASGLPLDPYFSFLYMLSQEYPVICRSGIKDAEGVFWQYTQDSACYERIHEYEMLQYQRLVK